MDILGQAYQANSVIDAAIRLIGHDRLGWAVATKGQGATKRMQAMKFPGDASWEYKNLVGAVEAYEKEQKGK